MKRILIIAMLFVIGSQGAEVMGQNIIRPKIACPNDIWVNSYNGVLFYQREDVSIPTAGEKPLAAVFYYNSSYADTNYGFGNGWTMSYEWWYEEMEDTVWITQGDGRRDIYLKEGNSYKSPAGVFNTLRKELGLFVLTTPEGLVYQFSDPQVKHVTHVTDRNGNTLQLYYRTQDDVDDPPLLTKIEESNGRALHFEYNQGLLVRLTVGELADHVWTYAYDGKGNLVSVTTPTHRTVYYGYDRANRINRFTDAAGNSTSITYSPRGEANRIKDNLSDMNIRYEHSALKTIVVDYLTDGNNQFTTYRWDTLGRVIEKTGNCCGYTSKLAYDKNNNIVSSKDALGNETTYTYDERGNMLTETDPLGHTESYTWHPQYNLLSTNTDRAGHQYTYTYDSKGNLVTITGPEGYRVQNTYNDKGQLTKRTDALGNETTFAYDAYGNLTSFTNPLGHSHTYSYDLMGNVLSHTDAAGGTTTYTYNAEGQMVTITDPTGARTTYTYNLGGYLQSVTRPGNSVYTFLQDPHGNLLSYTDPTGATTQYTYNAKDKITAVRDAMGKVSHYEYDDRDRMTLKTDPLGNTVRYTYDALGRPTAVAFSSGYREEYQYDALGQLTEVSDNLGIRYKTTYNALGQETEVLTARTRTGDDYTYDTTRSTYDARGRLVSVRRPGRLPVTYAYDVLNRLTSITDEGGNAQTFAYDGAGNLVSHTNPLQGTTTIAYDEGGRMVAISDAKGNTTTYAYDGAGHTTLATYPNNKTEQYTYDQRGNMTKLKDKAGNETRYTYDGADRLTAIVYPDGSRDEYTYDAMGRMLSVNGGGSTVTITYDALGRPLTEAVSSPFATSASAPTTAYTYDDWNGSTTITYPDGRLVKTEYDLRKRPMTVSSTMSTSNYLFQTAATYTLRADNRTETLRYGNGVSTSYRYGENLRASAIMAGVNESATVQNLHMSYDPLDNMVAQIDSVSLPRSEFYQYDGLGRLTQFIVGMPDNSGSQAMQNSISATENYTYDAVGNRTTANAITQSSNNTIAYTSNAVNGYTTVGNQALQYDGNGNLVSDGVHTYQYDYANRLVSVDNGNTATYSYDPLGRRIRKVAGGATTDYYYAGHQMIASTTRETGNDATTQLTTDYVYSPRTDDVLMAWRGDDKYYFHKNRMGNTVAITDRSGNVVERYSYDAFGAPQIMAPDGEERATSIIGNELLFTGREYDSETGLYYYRARTMNPALGRFQQMDPIEYEDGLNMYAYVYNNPANYIDPTGLRGTDCSNQKRDDLRQFDIGPNINLCLYAGIGGCVGFDFGLSFREDSWIPKVYAGFATEYGVGLGVSAGLSLDSEYKTVSKEESDNRSKYNQVDEAFKNGIDTPWGGVTADHTNREVQVTVGPVSVSENDNSRKISLGLKGTGLKTSYSISKHHKFGGY